MVRPAHGAGRGPLLDSFIQTVSRMSVERLHMLARDMAPLARAYRPNLVAANLARAFPDANSDALARTFYGGFAEVCLEVVRARAMTPGELRARVRCEGADALRQGNTVLLMAHHANMIWAVLAVASRIQAPMSVVYKPPHAAIVRDLLLAIAARFGVDLVPVREVRRKLVRKQHLRGRVWTLVADQRPGRDPHYAKLFGQRTAFFLGPERIARALKWPVYYLSCQRAEPGSYDCRVEKIAEPPFGAVGDVVERYVSRLQADIEHAPADWLWSHDRWRDNETP